MNDYGKKGGTSANAGKKAATYEATLPDGKVVRKKSFYVDADEAFIGAYQHFGHWYASGVTDKAVDGVPNFGGSLSIDQIAIPAKRVK